MWKISNICKRGVTNPSVLVSIIINSEPILFYLYPISSSSSFPPLLWGKSNTAYYFICIYFSMYLKIQGLFFKQNDIISFSRIGMSLSHPKITVNPKYHRCSSFWVILRRCPSKVHTEPLVGRAPNAHSILISQFSKPQPYTPASAAHETGLIRPRITAASATRRWIRKLFLWPLPLSNGAQPDFPLGLCFDCPDELLTIDLLFSHLSVVVLNLATNSLKLLLRNDVYDP